MTEWWQEPMLAFDIESTGVDPETDRIVTLVLDEYSAGGRIVAEHRFVVDPGVEIPEEAAAVHGYTTERARAEGQEPRVVVAAAVQILADSWARGVPLVAYNVAFDATMLDREARRHLGVGLTISGPVIDPLVLDKYVDPYVRGSGSRRLQPTAERYGIEITDWHDAAADAQAAQAIARALAVKHHRKIPMDLRDLWRLQVRARHEQATSLEDYFRRQGKTNDDGTPIVTDKSWPVHPFTEQGEA